MGSPIATWRTPLLLAEAEATVAARAAATDGWTALIETLLSHWGRSVDTTNSRPSPTVVA